MPSRLDSDLQGASAAHLVQCLLVVIEFEDVGHHSLGPDLSALKVFDGSWEAVGLRERSNDPNFVTENLGRWPRDTGLVLVDAVDKKRSPSSNVVDRILDNGFDSSRFDDDVEPERVVLLQFSPLRSGVCPVKFDVYVCGFYILRNVHLNSLVSCDNDLAGTIQFQKLRQHQASRARTQKEDFASNLWLDNIHAVNSASEGFSKRRLQVRDIVDLVQFVLRIDDVFSKATRQTNSPSPKVLAEQGLATTAVETVVALGIGRLSGNLGRPCRLQQRLPQPHGQG